MTALFLTAIIAIGSAALIAYRLGRWHDLELGLSLRFSNKSAGDDPATAYGDIPHLHQSFHGERIAR